MIPWLDKSTPLDLRALTTDALLDLWAKHRNDTTGLVAAEEICRRELARLKAGKKK